MSSIIDFHAHVFPNWPTTERFSGIRKQIRRWVRPAASSFHHMQTMMRHLPEGLRKGLDEVSAFVPLPGLLLESTQTDLVEAMDEAGIHYAVVIAHPPLISNEFIMEVCRENQRLLPVVNIPKGTPRPGALLKKYAAQGAKMLKIHSAADGEGVDSLRYKTLLRTASDLGLPVILHTGCIQSHLLYKDPNQGSVENFRKWFEVYSETKFILAHMNLHEPHLALDLGEEYSNVYVDTSWQPTEIIGEAARRLGAERVLFGTDWPLVGNNLTIGRKRVEDCISTGMLNADQAKLILGENAVQLLGLKNADRTHENHLSSL